MSPEQRALARHALGLPNEKRQSYRNRYYSPPAHPSHALWEQMVAAGEAACVAPPRGRVSPPYDHFELTPEGAALALEPGEHLDAEDFPKDAAA